MSEQLDSLIRRYRELGSGIAELEAERVEIKRMVDEAVEIGWKHSVDGVAVHKRPPNRKFNAVTAVSLLSPEARQECVVTRYDDRKLRAAVEELGELDACMVLDPDALPIVKL